MTAAPAAAFPATDWQKTYGGTDSDAIWGVRQTPEGGYAGAGATVSHGAGGLDGWLVKTDSSGDQQWEMAYGGTANDYLYAVVNTADGGYLMTGYSMSDSAGGQDLWLVKTDSSGNQQWEKKYGGALEDCGWAIQPTAGGYLVAGYTESSGAGAGDAWVIKIDASGDKLWDKTYGDTGYECATSIEPTADAGYILSGFTSSSGAGANDGWLLHIDAAGNELWDKPYGGTGGEGFWGAYQTADGGFICAGGTTTYAAGLEDAWLVRTDPSGNELWNRAYGGTGDDWAYSLCCTSDGGYVMAGVYDYSGSAARGDAWLIWTDCNGVAVWDQTFGTAPTAAPSCAYSVIAVPDGGYVTGGFTQSSGAGGGDGFLIKGSPVPLVTSLSATSGNPGATETVTGQNFGRVQGTSYVRFGTFAPAPADYLSWSDTSVQVKVPASAYYLAGVMVHTDIGGDSNASPFYVMPYIQTVSPTWGNAGKTFVTLTGTGFGPSRGANSIWFDGSKATTYSAWNNTQIRVQVGAGASGQSHVKVMVLGCYSNAKAFDVRPLVKSMSPASGPTNTVVTISGSSFCNTKGSGCVYFGSKAATTYTSWKQTQIKVKVPSGISGTVQVKIYTTGGMSNYKNFTKT